MDAYNQFINAHDATGCAADALAVLRKYAPGPHPSSVTARGVSAWERACAAVLAEATRFLKKYVGTLDDDDTNSMVEGCAAYAALARKLHGEWCSYTDKDARKCVARAVWQFACTFFLTANASEDLARRMLGACILSLTNKQERK